MFPFSPKHCFYSENENDLFWWAGAQIFLEAQRELCRNNATRVSITCKTLCSGFIHSFLLNLTANPRRREDLTEVYRLANLDLSALPSVQHLGWSPSASALPPKSR